MRGSVWRRRAGWGGQMGGRAARGSPRAQRRAAPALVGGGVPWPSSRRAPEQDGTRERQWHVGIQHEEVAVADGQVVNESVLVHLRARGGRLGAAGGWELAAAGSFASGRASGRASARQAHHHGAYAAILIQSQPIPGDPRGHCGVGGSEALIDEGRPDSAFVQPWPSATDLRPVHVAATGPHSDFMSWRSARRGGGCAPGVATLETAGRGRPTNIKACFAPSHAWAQRVSSKLPSPCFTNTDWLGGW